MKNNGRLEGNGAARLVQLMQKHGHNADVNVELATVLAPPPALKIRFNSDNLTLDADALIVAEHLTEHTRTVSISGGVVSGDVSPSGTLTSFTLSDAFMTVKTPLKAGDQVSVLSANDGQLYYVLDKAVV